MTKRLTEPHIRLVTRFYDDPDVLELSHPAFRLFVALLVWSKDKGTDGHATRGQLQRLAAMHRCGDRSLAELEQRKFLVPNGTGLVARNWPRYQITTTEQAEVREEKSRAGQQGNRQRWGEGAGSRTGHRREPVADATTSAIAGGIAGAMPSGIAEPVAERSKTLDVRDKTRENVPNVTIGSHPEGLVVGSAEPDPVLTICEAMADSEQRKGHVRPTITTAWKHTARLLLSRDGRSLEEVLAMIRWVEQDDFWWKNVRSVPKLREQFERLQDERKTPNRLSRGHQRAQETDAHVRQLLEESLQEEQASDQT